MASLLTTDILEMHSECFCNSDMNIESGMVMAEVHDILVQHMFFCFCVTICEPSYCRDKV